VLNVGQFSMQIMRQSGSVFGANQQSVSDDAVVSITGDVLQIDGVVVAEAAIAENAESVLEKCFLEWYATR
jgi:ABC-type Fe2+-enterobactin transport system substrate-binding protein